MADLQEPKTVASQYNLTPALINSLIDVRYKNNFTYISAAADTDLSALTTSHTVMVNVNMGAGNDMLLPAATALNGGMHIRVIIGIPQTNAWAIGPASGGLLSGAATFIGDATAGSTTANPALVQSLAATENKSVNIDGNVAAKGGDAGTILDFFYTGVANTIVFSGTVTVDKDTPTGASFFSTSQVAMS